MNNATVPAFPLFFPDDNSTLNKVSADRRDRPYSLYVGRYARSPGYSVVARDAPLIFILCELVPNREVQSFIADRNTVDNVMRAHELPPYAADLVVTYRSSRTEWWKVYRDDESAVPKSLREHCNLVACSNDIEYKVRWLKDLGHWEIRFNNWLRLNRSICVTQQLTGWAELMPDIAERVRLHGTLTIAQVLSLYPGDRSPTQGAIARLIQHGHIQADLDTRLISMSTIVRPGGELVPDAVRIQRESVNERLSRAPVEISGPPRGERERGRGRPRTVALNQPSIDGWPEPNSTLLGDLGIQKSYELKKQAVILYAAGAEAEDIWSATGISIDRARNLYKRCLVVKDNRMEGFYGLIRYRRQKEYERSAPVVPLKHLKTKGTAGAFEQLLRTDRDIREFLESYVVPPEGAPPRPYSTIRQIHGELLALLQAKGFGDDVYPLVRHSKGYQSVRRHIRDLQITYGVDMPGKKKPKYGPGTGTGFARLIKPHGPCSFLQLDYQEVPAACILVVSNEFGQEFELPIQRFSIAYLACESTEAIMGVGLEFEVQPSVDSALEAIHSALSPDDDWFYEGKLRFTQHGKFLLRHFIPELAWEGFLILRLDNALANKAHDLINNVVDTVGCLLHYGHPRGYWLRDVIERTIGRLQERGLVRLTSSYGSGLKDPRRDRPEAKAIESRIRLEDIISVLYAVIEDHNLAQSRTNQMSSRVEAVQAAISNPHFGFFSQPIPRDTRLVYRLLSHIEDRTISGNRSDGVYIPVGPYRYQNAAMARNFALVGQDVRIYIDRRDSRVARAFVKGTGEDLGVLMVRGAWSTWLISWRHRKLLEKAGTSPRYWARDPVAMLREEAIAAHQKKGKAGKKAESQKATVLAQMEQAELRSQSPYAKTQEAPRDGAGGLNADDSSGAQIAHNEREEPAERSGTTRSRRNKADNAPRAGSAEVLPGGSFGLNRMPRNGGEQ